MSSTLYVRRVVELIYAGSHRHSCNLTNMCRKALACIGLRVAMVPESYHRVWTLLSLPFLRQNHDTLLSIRIRDGEVLVSIGEILVMHSVRA
jgi:hypothetical protein